MARTTPRIAAAGFAVVGSLLTAGGTGASGATSATVSQTFTPVADAYVSSAKPDANYGKSPKLKTDASPIVRSYLRFDVEGLDGPIVKATLRLHTASGSTVGYDVRPVAANTWSETTITYSNAPSTGAVVGSSGAFASGAWTSVDVTALVVGDGVVSVAVTTPSTSPITVDSRETGSATAPQLVVETPAVPPTNTSAPTISGTATDGHILTADPGTWTGSAPITFSYQWRRCNTNGSGCSDITGATAQTFALTSADVGATIVVAVTASNTAASSSAASSLTGVVQALPPSNTSRPTISGTAVAGQTLTASTGAWAGSTPLAFSYQWRRCDTSGSACADLPGATQPTYTLGTGDIGSTLRVAVTADNSSLPGGGAASEVSLATPVVADPSSAPDPVVAAAGDIACDPASSSFNGGLGTSGSCRQKYTSDLLAGADLAAVLPIGDEQYECGGANAFGQSYDVSWGRMKAITHPAIGNHEYQTTGGTGCDTAGKAGGYFAYFGTAAGDPSKGYYSFDIGAWHVIALNTNNSCSIVSCSAGSPQEQWLKADLAAHPAICTLAFWHAPRFWSGVSTLHYPALWDDLYAAGADVILNGHVHNYERFAPQDPSGKSDPTRGIREFVVGTGGRSHGSFPSTIYPTSEVRNADTFGVLELTLHATSYDWKFVPEAGKTFTDSGSAPCH